MDILENADDRHVLIYNNALDRAISAFVEEIGLCRYDGDFMEFITSRLDITACDKDAPFIAKAIGDASQFAVNAVVNAYQDSKVRLTKPLKTSGDILAEIDAGVEEFPQ